MEVLLVSGPGSPQSVRVWKKNHQHLDAHVCDAFASGLTQLTESSEWILASLPSVRDSSPQSRLDDDRFDAVIYYERQEGCFPSAEVIDFAALNVIRCQKNGSQKRKARLLNEKEVSIDVVSEWTYIIVNEIEAGGNSIGCVAMKREVAEYLAAKDLDPFSESTWSKLAKRWRIGFVLNRFVSDVPYLDRFGVQKVFSETRKIVLDDGCQIVTACDDGMYRGLQLLLTSLYYSHAADVLVWDIGLKPEQVEWVKLMGFEVKQFDLNELIVPRDTHAWQTWNKPLYIQGASRDKVLWIDADAFVLRSLRPAFDVINERSLLVVADRFVFVTTSNPIKCIKNHEQLYKYMPTSSRIKLGHPNCGVIGVDKSSQKGQDIMAAWTHCVEHSRMKHIRKTIAWYDQGAFQWALEKTNNIDLIENDLYWNDCVNWNRYGERFCNNMTELFQIVPSLSSGIIHFAGDKKPWAGDDEWI